MSNNNNSSSGLSEQEEEEDTKFKEFLRNIVFVVGVAVLGFFLESNEQKRREEQSGQVDE